MVLAEPALAWAQEALGGEAPPSAEPLPGARPGRVWRLRFGSGEGGPATAVLKLARPASQGGDERLIAREVAVLKGLAPLGAPVPRVLAADPDGRGAGRPALLMTEMPGRLLAGADELEAAIPALAQGLVTNQRHAATLVAGRRWSPRRPTTGHLVPSWSTRENLWSRAIRVTERFARPRPDAFIQRDPHPANMLFDDGRVAAVLGWPHAGRGPAGIDGAAMAMNLACLLGLEGALYFRDEFEHCRGMRQDPLLDVYAATEMLPDPDGFAGWSAVGVSLTRDEVCGRLEAFLADAMRRMTTRRLS